MSMTGSIIKKEMIIKNIKMAIFSDVIKRQ